MVSWLLLPLLLSGCGQNTKNEEQKSKVTTDSVVITLDTTKEYQSISSFGASGAWWA